MRSLLVCLFAFSLLAAPPERWKDLTPEQVAAIDKAASQVTLSVKPAKKSKLLMATYAQGFWHNSIPYGAKALELIGEKTGAFSITRAEDPSAFTAENLAKFDAIVVNNVTGIDRWLADEASRAAFISFVNKGGGLFANHSASDGGWKEYSNLIGGRFAGHPWGSGGTWGFQVEDSKSLLARAFSQQQFTLSDEIYMLRDHFSRDTHRVIVSLDISDPTTDAAQSKGNRPDHDYPVTLIRRFGEGRVFYSVFGHREDIHSNPMLLQHYTDGLQYVLGDLKVKDNPPDVWERLTRFHVGRSAEVEKKILGMINDDSKAEIEGRFLALLSRNATTDAKVFVLDHLPQVWSDKSIPALSALITDPLINQRAIEALRAAAANVANYRHTLRQTLRKGLASAAPEAQLPLIHALGHEGDEKAIPALAQLATSPNQRVADSAILALGDIATVDCLPALRGLKPSHKVYDATLRIAENLEGDAAAAVYLQLLDAKPGAALRGLARAHGRKALPILTGALSGDYAVSAIGAIATIPGPAGDSALGDLSPADNSQSLALVTAWRKRGGARARAQLRRHAGSENELVASEAFRALGEVGQAEDLPFLIEGLKREDGAADIALDVLANFPQAGTDAALIAAIDQGGEISEILGARRAKSAAPALMRARLTEDSKISREAWKALANCATPTQLPELIGSFATVDSRAAGRLEDVILALKESADEAAIVAAIPSASEAGRASALSLLANFQSPASLAALRANLGESAALNALARWESPEPLDDLHAVARGAADKSTQVLSLRAFAAILGRQNSALAHERLLREYSRGFLLSKHPETTVDLLAAIASFGNENALELAAGFLSDTTKNIADAAWRAVTEMNGRVGDGTWTFAGSHQGEPLAQMVDRKPETRWSSGRPKEPGMWLSIDFGVSMPVRTIMLDNTNPANRSQNDIPQSASLQVSKDGKAWQTLKSTFKSAPLSTFTTDAKTRHLKINFDGDAAGSYWSIHELYINAKPEAGPKLKRIPAAAMTVTASEQPKHAGKAIDDNDGSPWRSDNAVTGDEWFEISFGELRKIAKLQIDSRRQKDEAPKNIAIKVSIDGERWSPPLLADKGSSKLDLSLYPAPIRKLRVLQTGRDSKRRWAIGELTLWER